MSICAGFDALCELIGPHPRGTEIPESITLNRLVGPEGEPLCIVRVLRIPICRSGNLASESVIVLEPGTPRSDLSGEAVSDVLAAQHIVVRRWAEPEKGRLPLMALILLEVKRVGHGGVVYFRAVHYNEFLVHY